MSGAHLPSNRARFTLREVLAATGGEIIHFTAGMNSETAITGVATDTRTLGEGSLFVALRGERFDGHNFLEQAVQSGAVAVLVETSPPTPLLGGEGSLDSSCPASTLPASTLTSTPPSLPGKGVGGLGLSLIRVQNTLEALGALAAAHRRRFSIPVIGVTGSYGKTTTRALIAAALTPKYSVLSSAGNFNNEIGVPQTLLQLDEAQSAAVVEMAMRGAGQIKYLADIAQPTIGVVTNIGPQHIELLGSLENIAAAKAELIETLPPDGVAVLPADDPFSTFLRERAACRVVTFGQSEAADYRVTDMRTENDGSVSFVLTHPSSLIPHPLKLPLPGAHNAINAAAALAVADILGVPLEDAARELAEVEIPGARMRVVKARGVTIIDDCYNAGPNSMRAALQTLLDFPGGGRRVAILGAMKELGAWTEAEHRKIGDFAGMFVEAIIGVGGETRPLLNALIQAAAQVESKPEVSWCEDAVTATERAREMVRAGDVVLVKGSRSVGLEVVVSALGNA